MSQWLLSELTLWVNFERDCINRLMMVLESWLAIHSHRVCKTQNNSPTEPAQRATGLSDQTLNEFICEGSLAAAFCYLVVL